CYFQFVMARELQRVPDVVERRDSNDAVDGCLVEVAGVVDESAELRKRESRRWRVSQGQCGGVWLVWVRRGNKIGIFLLRRRRRIFKKLPCGHNEKPSSEEECRKQRFFSGGGGCVLHKPG